MVLQPRLPLQPILLTHGRCGCIPKAQLCPEKELIGQELGSRGQAHLDSGSSSSSWYLRGFEQV